MSKKDNEDKIDKIPQEGRDDKGRFALSNLFWHYRSSHGREPKYDNADEMVARIYEYLQYEEKASKGKFTIEGCALYLGFASRQSIHDYKDKDSDFSYIIGRFFLFMSHYHSQGLKWVGSFQGSQFWLKNFGGYKDESIQHQRVEQIKANFGSDTIQPAPESENNT